MYCSTCEQTKVRTWDDKVVDKISDIIDSFFTEISFQLINPLIGWLKKVCFVNPEDELEEILKNGDDA
jgi:hypothetical protein